MARPDSAKKAGVIGHACYSPIPVGQSAQTCRISLFDGRNPAMRFSLDHPKHENFIPFWEGFFSKRFLQRGMGSKREFWERACMKGLLNPAQRIIGQQPRK
jgi:hypothetical protein